MATTDARKIINTSPHYQFIGKEEREYMSEENKQIEKFDPSKLMDGVRDRIKATFISLIPDAQWEQLVKTECEKYFKIENNYSSYRDNSLFGQEVQRLLAEEVKTRVKDYLSKEWATTYWNGGGVETLNENLKKLLIDKSGEVLIGTLGTMLQNTINQMKNNNY